MVSCWCTNRGLEYANRFAGASAIQIVPQISKVAEKVIVFQRSPNWITPRNDVVIGPLRRAAYQYLPLVRRLHRGRLMDLRESFWEVLVDTESPVHHMVKDFTIQALERDLPGDKHVDIRRTLTPDYPPGCKRILISDDYYPALAQPHVTLETAQIMHAKSEGLWVDSGWNSVSGDHDPFEHKCDVLVYATGFKATQFLHPMNVRVKGKPTSLHEQWEEVGAQAYLGMTVAGFPNFAVMFGPNTNLGHNSIILMIEAQSQYINRLISAVCKSSSESQVPGTYLSIQPKAGESDQWNTEVQEGLGRSTLASALCSSWYRATDGRITTNWSGTAVNYQKAVSSVAWSAFDLQGPGAKELLAKGQTSWARVVEESRMMERVLAWGSVVGMAFGSAAYAWHHFS
jgi:cation diffusion facilitator CzcD-associated flavoprotein CzcO